MSVEAFAEGGASLIRNTILSPACPLVCTPGGCACPGPLSFSNAGRLFTGARLRTGRDAIEVSYSYSPNQIPDLYNRLNVFSLNYVHYLSMRSKVQPFATIGLGADRFSFSGPYSSSNGFRFVWNYGGGTDIVLQRHLALRLELRDYVGGQPSYFIGTGHDIVPSAGVVFKFR
jgi:opacity protein-like surface antigen